MSKEEKEYKFSGKVVRCTYDTPDFRIFALDVDSKKYPDIKKNKYNNVTILGELHELTVGVTYEISAVEQLGKYGMSYKVLNIKRDVPTTEEDMYLFLSEILTPNQAKVLYENYPDIVQRVKENRLDDIDFNKLKGIKEYTFGVIKRKIIENFCLADLVVEFQGFLNLSMIKKIYAKYTSIEKLKEKLAQDPYKCLCGLAGVGFKTADDILLDMEKASKANIEKGKKPIIEFQSDLRTSPERCLSCLLYMLEENENKGHTKMNLADLRAEMMKLVPACANHFVTAVKADEIHYNKDTMDVALSRTYNLEHKIAQTILYVLHTKKDEWDCDIEKYRTVNGSTLSDEQMGAVANVCKHPISILNGAGGTGKSFSTQAVINMLKDHHKTFRLFSPTGKAAKVLADYTKENATTIHRGLGYTPMGWGYNQEHKIMCDIVIIDEFSMVDIQLFKRVIDAVDFNTTKLLLIGDNAQLPSVSCGNLLHDFMETKLIPTTTLTKVFRYGEGGLMKVATDVRFCEPYLTSSMKSKMTTFGDNKDYTFVDLPSEVIPQNVVGLYKKLLEKGYSIDDIQVLTAKNVGDCGTVVLNNMIQKVANPNYGSEVFMKVGDTTYFEGDLVIQKVNNYKAELDLQHLSEWEKDMYSDSEDVPTAFIANGETGIVREIYKSYCIIEFDGVFVKYYRADMQMISLGYSITIHKSQGSSIKIVILCTPQSHIYMLNSNLLYVGLTRMKEGCYHLGALNSINQAVKKKANLTRHTHMQELLLTMPEEEYMALEKSEKKKPEIDGTEGDTEELPWI
jgi:exodeoxyribonuclease V alpha subunit